MSITSTNYAEDALVGVPGELAKSELRLRWFELCLVLLVTCGPPFLTSLDIFLHGHQILPLLQRSRWGARFLPELAGLMLLGYVLSRNKASFREIGLRWSIRDLGVGLLLTIPAYLFHYIGYYVIYSAFHAWFPGALQQGVTAREIHPHHSLVAIPFLVLNAFFEELIVRAYLMTEIGKLTGSWLLAIAISTVVQSSYHLYYGWAGMLGTSFLFLVFSIYYAKKRKALPVIVAHGIVDLIALIRLW